MFFVKNISEKSFLLIQLKGENGGLKAKDLVPAI